jgi:hypothetical protein
VNSNPFELLYDFIMLSIESFFLNTHCIVGAGLAKMLTVMVKEVPFCKPIISWELDLILNGNTNINKQSKNCTKSILTR